MNARLWKFDGRSRRPEDERAVVPFRLLPIRLSDDKSASKCAVATPLKVTVRARHEARGKELAARQAGCAPAWPLSTIQLDDVVVGSSRVAIVTEVLKSERHSSLVTVARM